MSAPRVSVVIGAYNCENFIQDTIKSVISQTFTDWELIIVDDGSDDDTCAKIESIDDDRTRLIRLDKNSGRPAVSRNVGIRASVGEFIAFLDHDDLWNAQKLEKQVELMDRQGDVFLVYTKCFVQQGGEVLAVSPINPKSGYIFKELFLAYNMFPCSTVMIRNRRTPDAYLFNEEKKLMAIEDYDLWLRIAYKHKVAFVDEPLATYRLHANNTSKGAFPFFKRIYIIIRKYSGMVPKYVLFKKYISFFGNLFKNYAKYLLDHLKGAHEYA